jgi:hypothetical protein
VIVNFLQELFFFRGAENCLHLVGSNCCLRHEVKRAISITPRPFVTTKLIDGAGAKSNQNSEYNLIMTHDLSSIIYLDWA